MAAQKLYIALLVTESTSGNDPKQLTSIAAVLTKIERQMHRLVHDLVDIVAMESGKLGVTLRAHSASDLLAAATAVY